MLEDIKRLGPNKILEELEFFDQKIVEAMARVLPILAERISSHSEITKTTREEKELERLFELAKLHLEAYCHNDIWERFKFTTNGYSLRVSRLKEKDEYEGTIKGIVSLLDYGDTSGVKKIQSPLDDYKDIKLEIENKQKDILKKRQEIERLERNIENLKIKLKDSLSISVGWVNTQFPTAEANIVGNEIVFKLKGERKVETDIEDVFNQLWLRDN